MLTNHSLEEFVGYVAICKFHGSAIRQEVAETRNLTSQYGAHPATLSFYINTKISMATIGIHFNFAHIRLT